MKKLTFVTSLALSFSLISCGGSTSSDQQPKEASVEDNTPVVVEEKKEVLAVGASLSELMPAGYVEQVRAEGLLNKDSLKDVAIVYGMGDEEGNRVCRVYLQEPGGGYKLFAENKEVVLCAECGGMMGDPFVEDNFKIKNQGLYIGHHGGSAERWDMGVEFSMNDAEELMFSRLVNESFNVNDPEVSDKNVKTAKETGAVKFAAFKY